MRRARFTFEGAFHHVMNRGHNKSIIFPTRSDKFYFINLIHLKAKLLRIKILAYTIMDNHYHIILQNTSNKLSDFMKQINSIYATYFRKKYGGCGYVFANRFKSTLIQNNSYLLIAILYTLKNPVRAKLVLNPYEYKYSSINEYFNLGNRKNITDNKFVEELFGSRNVLKDKLEEEIKIKENRSRMGKVLGDKKFIKESLKKFDRRKENKKGTEKRRIDERPFKKYREIKRIFEIKEGIKVREINIRKIEGKRKRIILLKLLREEGGYKYKEINRLRLYQNLKLNSLSVLYLRA